MGQTSKVSQNQILLKQRSFAAHSGRKSGEKSDPYRIFGTKTFRPRISTAADSHEKPLFFVSAQFKSDKYNKPPLDYHKLPINDHELTN